MLVQRGYTSRPRPTWRTVTSKKSQPHVLNVLFLFFLTHPTYLRLTPDRFLSLNAPLRLKSG